MKRLKHLWSGASDLERRLATTIESAAQAVAGTASFSALEVLDLACDEIATHVQPIGRGRYALPFNRATVTFAAPTTQDRARYEALCDGPPSFEERVRRRLVSARWDHPELDVVVAFTDTAAETWTRPEFRIDLARVGSDARVTRAATLRIDVLVTSGTAERGAYTFTQLPIAIGRGADVRDSRHQLLRINHVAFTEDGDDVNKTVSRRHARIELDPDTGRPRLIDDNSAQGTSIIRGGRGLQVPRGSRGLGLQTDDEIALGRAKLKVRIGVST